MDPDVDRGDPEGPLPDVLTDALGKHPKLLLQKEKEWLSLNPIQQQEKYQQLRPVLTRCGILVPKVGEKGDKTP